MVRTPSLIGERGRQLLLMALAMAAAGYVRTAVSPLQEAMRVALTLSDNQMAVVQGPAIGIPVALTCFPLGLLIDRCNRVRLLQILAALSVLGTLITAISSGFVSLALARALAGACSLGILPVVLSLIGDLFGPSERGIATTIVILGQVAGNSVAFALGGLVLVRSGPSPDVWRVAMLLLCLPLLSTVFLAWLQEPSRAGGTAEWPPARRIWGDLRAHRAAMVPLVIGIMMAEVAVGATIIWGAPMLSRRFELSPDRIGVIMAIGLLVAGVLGSAVGGPLADMCHRSGGPRRTIAVLAILAAATVPASFFAYAPGVKSASVMLIGTMSIMLAIAVMGMTLFNVVVPGYIRGVCMATLVAGEIIFSLAVAPPVVSILSGAIGGVARIGDALSVICLTAGAIATMGFAIGWVYMSRLWVLETASRPQG